LAIRTAAFLRVLLGALRVDRGCADRAPGVPGDLEDDQSDCESDDRVAAHLMGVTIMMIVMVAVAVLVVMTVFIDQRL
jgi:hypothetical protein